MVRDAPLVGWPRSACDCVGAARCGPTRSDVHDKICSEFVSFTLSRVEPHRRSESSLVDSVLLSGSCARRDHEAAPHSVQRTPERDAVPGSYTFAARTAAWCHYSYWRCSRLANEEHPNDPNEGGVKMTRTFGQFPVVYRRLFAHIIVWLGLAHASPNWLGQIQ